MVSSRAPSVQRSRALRAATLFANSTLPLPVGRPRSSVTTTARSTGPNWENAWGYEAGSDLESCNKEKQLSHSCSSSTCSRSSLVTAGSRLRTVSAAPCVAKRILIGRLFTTVPSSSALAISASVRVSYKTRDVKLHPRCTTVQRIHPIWDIRSRSNYTDV